MAWPLTPLTTYVANTPPFIKASDLNDIQAAINAAYGGTYSFKGIVIDGTGGAVVAAAARTIAVTGGAATLSVAAGGLTVTPTGSNTTFSVGDVSTTSGMFSAGGTVSGNTGPGLVKCKRLYTTGTAVTANTNPGVQIISNWGGTGTIITVAGTDMAGSCIVTAGNTPATGANPVWRLTFQSGTFTTTPNTVVVLRLVSDVTTDLLPINWIATNTALTVTYHGTPTDGRTYEFEWICIGN